MIGLASFLGASGSFLLWNYITHQNQQPEVKIINNTYTKTYYNNIKEIFNNTRIYNYTYYKCSQSLEKILNEYSIFKTNQSIVPLKVENILQLSNNSDLIVAKNPYTGNYTIIISPINESYFELTNGSNIPLQNILQKLPNNQNLYLLLKINNPNNISESGIYYIGNFSGNSIIGLSENVNIAYFITSASPDQLANYLPAVMNEQAKTLMLTSNGVWKDPDGLWGYDNATKQSVIISGPSSLINGLDNYVNIADQILKTNASNPGQYGVLPIVITQKYNTSEYQGYKAYNINPNDSIGGILLVPSEGHQIIPNIVNDQPAFYLGLPSTAAGIVGYLGRTKLSKYTDNPLERATKRTNTLIKRNYDIFVDSTPLTY